MKPIVIFSLAIFWLLSACQPSVSPSVLTLDSPSTAPIVEVPVVLDRPSLSDLLGSLSANQALVFTVGGATVPHQYDDWDGDGAWDEVFLLLDFPESTLSLEVTKVETRAMDSLPVRTNLHLGKVIVRDSLYESIREGNRVMGTATETTIAVYQYEGPGWENDHIAFRTYFDERNGIDIFGKQTTEMILEKVGVKGSKESYHLLQDWGMDILKVANSLGAGALALQYRDSLYRVTGDSTSTCRFLVEGPLRSGFEMYFPKAKVGDTTVSLRHRISIVAGVNGYQSQVEIDPFIEGMNLVAGIVNLESDTCYTVEEGDVSLIYTHDQQAYDGEFLGMALMASTSDVIGQVSTPEEGPGITQTFGLSMRLNAAAPTRFWFLAGWEVENSAYQSREGFLSMLLQEANKVGK